MKWEKVAIEKLPIDLIDGDRGTNYPKMNEFYDEEYCLFLNTSNVLKTGFDFSKCQFINQEKDEKLRKGKLSKDDIVLTTRGTLGNTGYFSDKVSFDNIRINSGMIIMRNKDKKQLDSSFIYYSIRENNFQTQIVNARSGSAQPQLPIGTLKKLKFSLPPLPTQRNIAAILSAYDDLIENNLKRTKLLEEKAQLHYKIEFGEFQFGDKEPKNLPNGWSIKSIAEIYGKLESGSRPKGGIDKELKEGIASVGAENVIGLGKYNYESEKLITEVFYENMNRGKIENKDILIYKDGAYIGKTTLFQDSFPHEKCCVNEHVFLLRSKEVLYQNYLFFTLYQKLYFEKMQQLNANAAQPGINQESLKSLKIPWPTKNVITEFNEKVESLMKLIFVLAKQNTKLRAARDILLPRLMSGQIEV